MSADRITLWLAVGATVAFLTLCALIGMRRQVEQQAVASMRRKVRPLTYGQRFPAFNLATMAGGRATSGELRGRWTLLVLATTWCPDCASELRSLARARKQLSRSCRILPVLEGPAILRSPSNAAIQYAQRNKVPFDIAVDPDERLGTACGVKEGRLPHAVLVDPKGEVRLTMGGHQDTKKGGSKLSDVLICFFAGAEAAGAARDSSPLYQWPRFRPAPDASVLLQSGERTSLARLSHSQTLVVTFLTGDDIPSEVQRTRAIRQFQTAPGVRFLFVVKNPAVKPVSLGADVGLLVAERETRPLFTAYQVNRGPVSMIMREGRNVLGETVALPSGEAFENELAYAVLLSGSGNLPGPQGTPTWSARS